ncbi:MAG: hypothetical protein LBG80_11180 [Bacteroidales bacterium]|jgi:hypothetical protein|nr:hypothetical protein [Bacteroidales bacterium]
MEGIFLLGLGIVVVLFLILRKFNTWYWKIDEKISIAQKTNFLLEKILVQLGGTTPTALATSDEVLVEEIATGKRERVKINKWLDFQRYNPKKAPLYKVVEDEEKKL